MTIRDAVRPSLFSLFLGVLATGLAVQALWLTYATHDFLSRVPEAWPAFAKAGIDGMAFRLALAVGVLSIIVLAAAVLAVVRRGWVLRLIQGVCIGGYLVLVYAVRCAMKAVEVYGETGIPFVGVQGEKTRVVYFLMQAGVFKWILPALAGFAAVHFFTARRSTINLYTGQSGDGPAFGDRLLEDLRVGGTDPEYRKCWLMSLGTHTVAILLLPLLLQAGGCATKRIDPPRGVEGGPPVVRIKFVKMPRKAPKMIENPNSPILFVKPLDFAISALFDQVREETEMQYVTDVNRLLAPGNNPQGRKQGPGLSWGTGKGKVCFVRLSYKGDGWNDGLDGKQPSYNLLRELGRAFPDLKIDYTEKVEPIKALSQYVKGYAPPFVYMTGDGRIDIPDSELRCLRQYLQDGGMLFADCGSPAFHHAFCAMVSRLLPGDRLVNLSDDDEIFNVPFFFPNGAPPIWPHGGDRAMGVRYRGRLCVFYHPGDLNDAWKTGRSGATQEKADMAFQMGMNVMYYAFKNYAKIAAKYKK